MTNRILTDEELLETIAAFKKFGTKAEAGEFLKIPRTTVNERIKIAKRRGLYEDPSNEYLESRIPDGQKLRGVSTLYNKDGSVAAQWVKTREDIDRTIEIIQEAAAGIVGNVKRAPKSKAPKKTRPDLLCFYPITDYHLGMMAKAGETGLEWNTAKATNFLLDWFDSAIKSAPDAKQAVFWQGGDFFHYDSIEAVTPTGKNLMDTDVRYSYLVRVGVEVLRSVIDLLLQKHEKVHIVMGEGNHDISSSIWLRLLFSHYYANEKRLTFDVSETPYYAYQFGKTSLFMHHGHKQKVAQASKVFTGMFPKIFGDTEFRYAHMGDKHHIEEKEDQLMLVTQHPTLAPKDAYSARHGYLSNRAATVITYSSEHGEISRVTIRPEMVGI